MSRKHLFANLEGKDGSEAGASAPAATRQRPHIRPLLGAAVPFGGEAAAPVGAIGRSLEAAAQKALRADEIERRLAEGASVVELDPSAVDPSFIADRMAASADTQTSLLEAIRDNGQQVPILVRPHPDGSGRYQAAYGHRRLRAARELGRPVRAVVRALSDEELAIAQGQENNERRDLSYIEKARFAHALEQKFDRKTVMAALSIYKSDLSNMLSVVARIPSGIIEAVGPAPATGRRGWIELAEAVAKKGSLASVEKAVADPGFSEKTSDERFASALAATQARMPTPKVRTLRAKDRREIGKLTLSASKVTLSVDRRKEASFAAFVVDRLEELYQEFETGAARPEA